VVAVEIDREIIAILEEALAPYPNATIVNADFLSINVPDFLQEHFGDAKVKVLGNLPYYITSPIVSRLLEVRDRIESVVMMVQKEVAMRLKADPGTRDYGSMSVFVQYYAQPEIVSYVSKNVFMPPPEVSSAVVKLTPRPSPPVLVPSEETFFNIVHCAFGKRRKTLLNSLSDCSAMELSKERVGQVLQSANIDPSRRAETLSLEEFAQIARAVI
jgi:16S rRNA (adenine1518-N6/adenine1519-N6)-dimethyltransferase